MKRRVLAISYFADAPQSRTADLVHVLNTRSELTLIGTADHIALTGTPDLELTVAIEEIIYERREQFDGVVVLAPEDRLGYLAAFGTIACRIFFHHPMLFIPLTWPNRDLLVSDLISAYQLIQYEADFYAIVHGDFVYNPLLTSTVDGLIKPTSRPSLLGVVDLSLNVKESRWPEAAVSHRKLSQRPVTVYQVVTHKLPPVKSVDQEFTVFMDDYNLLNSKELNDDARNLIIYKPRVSDGLGLNVLPIRKLIVSFYSRDAFLASYTWLRFRNSNLEEIEEYYIAEYKKEGHQDK